MIINRGDIYYIERMGQYTGNEIAKDRPGVIVSAEHLNAGQSCVEVVYLTTKPKKEMEEHVPVLSAGKTSTALCEQIYSVTVDRLKNYCGRVTEEEMRNMDRALASSLGLNTGENKMQENRINTPLEQDSDRVKIERDMYKELYEKLLDRITG